jgi:hypothetical protein
VRWEYARRVVYYHDDERNQYGFYAIPFIIYGDVEEWVDVVPQDDINSHPGYASVMSEARLNRAVFRGLTDKEWKDVLNIIGE